MEEKLELKILDKDEEEFALCNENGDILTRFSVEYEREKAIISYDTKPDFQNKGYASKGLNLLKKKLFESNKIFILELINLSGEYSQKVAENAEFFPRGISLNCYQTIHPYAEEILERQIASISTEDNRGKKLLEKIRGIRKIQNNAKQKLADELDTLIRRENEEDLDEEYRQRIEKRIKHLEKIVDNSIERE